MFIDFLTDILGQAPSANVAAWIFGAFVIFGLYIIVLLIRGVFK